MDQSTKQPREPRPKFTPRKKVIAIGLISLFLLIGTTILVLKPITTSYRPKAEAEPNPQCRLDVVVAAAAPTQTPTNGPSSTPTIGPTATKTPTPTVRPTATRTPTLRPTATRTPTLRPTATSTVRPTATSTPIVKPTSTPTRIPLPVPFPSCNNLSMTESDGTNNGSIALNQSVTFTATFGNNYGILRAGKCKNDASCTQLYGDTDVIGDLALGYSPITRVYTPPSAGKYIFEVNAYEGTQCNFFCSAGTYRYEYKYQPHSCTDSASEFQRIDGPGTCTNPCRKYLTVTSP